MQTEHRPRRLRIAAWIAIAVVLVLAVLIAAIQLAVLAFSVAVVLVVVIALVVGWNVLMRRLGWHLPAPRPGDKRAQQFRRARRRGRSL